MLTSPSKMSGTMPNSTDISYDEEAIFRHARDRFFQHLSSEDRAAFVQINSLTGLLDNFKKLQATFKDDSRWMKMFSAVKTCNDRLQPYFKIIDIITQAHPEWAAIAWGAFRLILQVLYHSRYQVRACSIIQVASNFVGFFEKLADILSQVASLIPAYGDVLQLDLSNPSYRFRLSLSKFYEDLLEFFLAVLHLFTQRSGSKNVSIDSLPLKLKTFRAQANTHCNQSITLAAVRSSIQEFSGTARVPQESLASGARCFTIYSNSIIFPCMETRKSRRLHFSS